MESKVAAASIAVPVAAAAATAAEEKGMVMGHYLQVKTKTYVVEGDPKEMICDVAEQMQVDLIAIGSHGFGRIERAFIESVSNYVIHHAKCPVLVIKAPRSAEATPTAM